MEHLVVSSLPQDAAKSVQEKQLLLSRLLARLAHEIRNPLSSIDIHTQLLEEDVANAPLEVRARSVARFRIIRTEIERLNNLVKQFLSLAGRNSVNPQPIAIKPIVEHVCALLRPEAAAHAIDITGRVPDELPKVVADADQLTQALVNLLLNAIQAVGRDGRVEVAATVNADDGELLITVSDTGPGIDPENVSTLFEPFFTTKEDGSGLGLWVVRQIAVAHDGSVDAANGPTGGAVFTMTLPLRRGGDEAHG